MFKVLFRIGLSLGLFIIYVHILLLQALWSNNFKKVTGVIITEFLDIWDMSADDLYVKGKGK